MQNVQTAIQSPGLPVAVSGTFRFQPYNVKTAKLVGYAIRTTGTLAGTWSVQYSNDYVDGVDDPTSDAKWDTYTLTTTPPAAAGSPQTFGITLDFYEFAFVRVKFTLTSGSGNVFIAAQFKA